MIKSCLRGLGLFLAFSLGLPGLAAEGGPETWNERLQRSDRLVKSGEYTAAREVSRDLLDEMGPQLLPGDQNERALGSVLAVHALALAGAERWEDAAWYWFLALSLKPELEEVSLQAYGEAGERMEQTWERERDPEMSYPDCTGDDLQPLKKLHSPAPQLPRALRKAGISGQVLLETIVHEDGRISHPTVMSSPAPGLSWAAAEQVRRWRFRPARCAGQPVTVYYRLQFNFVPRR